MNKKQGPAVNNSNYNLEKLSSFDRGTHGWSKIYKPDRYRFWKDSADLQKPRISRGAGLSYAAASFLDESISISHSNFNRLIEFDKKNNLIRVESGITLAELFSYLELNGLYLPIQPGYSQITIGGCIASNVHGKNHARDGSFINQIQAITLFHPTHGTLEISPDHEKSVFDLTCGGFGLTGHILFATLKVQPIPAKCVLIQKIPFESAEEGLSLLNKQALDCDFSYSWHDMCNGVSDHFGKGFICQGKFVSATNTEEEIPEDSFLIKQYSLFNKIPISLLNRASSFILNKLYYHQQISELSENIPLYNALYPIQKNLIYFGLYGQQGFHEYQVVIPDESLSIFLEKLHQFLKRYPSCISLASGKSFGGKNSLLRFTGKGTCLALNFPRDNQSPNLLRFLDQLTIDTGSLPNIIKDSRISAGIIDQCYPEAELFRAQLRAYDPKRLFRSELSERLSL